jgi:hypothetical protein
MSARLLHFRDVPEDEQDEIRALLGEASIEFYETPPGLFGLSPPALWLRDPQQLERARALLATYQTQRFERQRSEYERARAAGELPGLWASMRARPWPSLGLLILLLGVLFALSLPFLWLGR